MSIVGEQVFPKDTEILNPLISYLLAKQHFHRYGGRLSIPLQKGSNIVEGCSSAVGNHLKAVYKRRLRHSKSPDSKQTGGYNSIEIFLSWSHGAFLTLQVVVTENQRGLRGYILRITLSTLFFRPPRIFPYHYSGEPPYHNYMSTAWRMCIEMYKQSTTHLLLVLLLL